MQHIHFGAGHFGLGLGVYTFERAGAKSIIFNRASSNESIAGEDRISRRERNAILRRSKSFILDIDVFSPNNETLLAEVVNYHSFHEYRLITDLFQNDLFEENDKFAITASLGATTGYEDIFEFITILRKKSTAPIYLLPLENAISKTEILSKQPNFLVIPNLVIVDCCVDRMCTAFDKTQNGRLTVRCEKHASLIIQKIDGDTVLERYFQDIVHVHFTDHIDIEKQRKLWVFNGSHALIASLAAYYRFGEIHLYLSEERTKSHPGTPTLNDRRFMAQSVIAELTDSFSFWLQENYKTGNHSEWDERASIFGQEILSRMSLTPDASRRVLRRLLTPKLLGDGTYSNTPMEFFDWIHPRLVPALQLYVKYKGSLPREICMTLAKMFEMLGDGRFIDSSMQDQTSH